MVKLRHLHFKDFVGLQRGFDLPARKVRSGPYPVVGSTSIIGHHDEWKVEPPGVVTGRSGSLGGVQYVEGRYWPHNTALWVKDFKGNLPKYVYYYLQTLNLERFNSGAGVPTLNRNDLDTLEIDVHGTCEQRKIAAILSAYDDLIENNTRRIKILEEMARAIYTEWFVNFRFPGHKKVKMVDSELGPIPEGWEIRRIGDVLQMTGGGTPPTDRPECWNGGHINWYTPSDLTSSGTMFMHESSKRITSKGLANSSARLFQPHCVMMTSRATIGVVAINSTEACTNQGFIVCIPNELASATQVYFWIKGGLDLITSIASGATYKEISRSEFRELPFPIAPVQVRRLWKQASVHIFRQVEILEAVNRNLRHTRDLLLPKLVSGELDVSGLNAGIPHAPDV